MRRWLRITAVAAALFQAVFVWRSSFLVGGRRCFSLLDDAMISMRYARNLAEGHGLRRNPGEAPVEGYTNFLWTLVLSALHLTPVEPERVSLLVMLLGSVLLVLDLLVVERIAAHVAGSASPAIPVGVFLVATCYPLTFWTLRGTEVGLLCLLTNLAVVLVLRLHDRYSAADVGGLALVLCLAVLTRPGAVVPAAVVVAFLAFVAWRSGFRAPYLLVPLALLGVLAAQTVLRVRYYGDPLPNTYYLKLTGVPLLHRVTRGAAVMGQLVAHHLWPAALLPALGIGLLLHAASYRATRPEAAAALASAAAGS